MELKDIFREADDYNSKDFNELFDLLIEASKFEKNDKILAMHAVASAIRLKYTAEGKVLHKKEILKFLNL